VKREGLCLLFFGAKGDRHARISTDSLFVKMLKLRLWLNDL
jgi:hypothetical protein